MPKATRPPQLEKTQDANSLVLSTLIRGLYSLADGPGYISQLIAYGREAIPVLADLLLNSKLSGVPQPRQWTVEALAGLGAYEVLVCYLRQPLQIQSPIVRHTEEAVQNTDESKSSISQIKETVSSDANTHRF